VYLLIIVPSNSRGLCGNKYFVIVKNALARTDINFKKNPSKSTSDEQGSVKIDDRSTYFKVSGMLMGLNKKTNPALVIKIK